MMFSAGVLFVFIAFGYIIAFTRKGSVVATKIGARRQRS